MSQVKIFWDPKGFELDSLGKKGYLRATDGDTPYVSVPIRMLSIDTPEMHYPGNQKPSKHDSKLEQLADWIDNGKAPITSGLAEHLSQKLATGEAGTLQERQGKDAHDNKRGVWQDKMTLTGYEFRMCVKLYDVTKKLVGGKKLSSSKRYGWITRYCADMTTGKIFYPQDYFRIAPYNRIFMWPEDVSEAVGKMNLSPGW